MSIVDPERAGSCQQPGGERSGDEPHPSWDLDTGDLRSWIWAQQACLELCPVLDECVGRRDRLYPRSENPLAVIWAGVAYGDTGQVLDRRGLRRRAATQQGRNARNVELPDTRTLVG